MIAQELVMGCAVLASTRGRQKLIVCLSRISKRRKYNDKIIRINNIVFYICYDDEVIGRAKKRSDDEVDKIRWVACEDIESDKYVLTSDTRIAYSFLKKFWERFDEGKSLHAYDSSIARWGDEG
jgi:hypothetical protein